MHEFHGYSRRQRRNVWDYLLPFFILLCLLAVFTLGVQLIRSIRSEQRGGLSNKVYLYIDRGSAEVLPWGLNNFTKAHHGTLLLEGDRLRTDERSFVVLAFFDGTFVRLNQDTEIVLQEVSNDRNEDVLTLQIIRGEAWITTTHRRSDKALRMLVKTPQIVVEPVGSIFTVEHVLADTIRVFSGKARVHVREALEGEEFLVDSFLVGIGQEITFSDRQFTLLRSRRNVADLLAAVADTFKQTTFYQWNREEDLAPTAYVPANVERETVPEKSPVVSIAGEATDSAFLISPSIHSPLVSDTVAPPAPIIREPRNLIVRAPEVLISGTVSSDTMKVIAQGKGAGYTEDYELTKYVAGSGQFSYVAATRFHNLSSGKNYYAFHSEDAAGNRSEPSLVTIYYEPYGGNTLLSAPRVLSFNDDESSEVSVDSVLVRGEVDPSTVRVVVNGYALQAFAPESGQWLYYAAAKFGTMKPGLNRYRVYAEDASGNRSPVTTFTILWEEKESTEDLDGQTEE